jgi:hypothetical protein
LPHVSELPFAKRNHFQGGTQMPAILLWLLGVPIPVIILLILLFHS